MASWIKHLYINNVKNIDKPESKVQDPRSLPKSEIQQEKYGHKAKVSLNSSQMKYHYFTKSICYQNISNISIRTSYLVTNPDTY